MGIRLILFRDLLKNMRPGRLLDLGAGHGKFSLIAQELGWQVTAVDARTERMPMSPGIEWIHSDIRDFSIGRFDCICILGLLYHLELFDQIALLKRCAPTVTVLDTHFALEASVKLGEYEGRFFEEQTEALTASFGNKQSFWPTESSLIRMLHNCGYRTAEKQLPQYREDRAFFLAR
ncbi:MAG: class I SAM-dependent methyltransferase [Bdellovibrionota bacterium]